MTKPNEPRVANDNQGEGDRDADRHYRRSVADYLKEHRPETAARKAEQAVKGDEAAELERAAREGEAKARH